MKNSTLKDIPLFYSLDDTQLAIIEKIVETKTFNKSDMVFEAGSDDKNLYIVKKGSVNIKLPISNSNSSKQPVIHKVNSKDFFGEVALLDNKPRSASAICSEETELFVINSELFNGLVNNFIDIGYIVMKNLCKVLSQKIRQTDTILEETIKLVSH